MKILKFIILALFVGGIVWSVKFTQVVEGQGSSLDNSTIAQEDIAPPTQSAQTQAATEAPTGFDNQTNGFVTQAEFDAARETFEEVENIEEDGLGPVFNRNSCAACHLAPITGGSSSVTELRAGHFDGTNFIDHPGGSLINELAIDQSIQENVLPGNEVTTRRGSINLFGDGFVEAINSTTLREIANDQRNATGGVIAGQVISVPVGEADSTLRVVRFRVGRFGWKNQHASLISFSADAYLNEMGITSPLQPTENTSNGRSVAAFDAVPDPEDDGEDITAFATFIRALKAPSRDRALAATADARTGSNLFNLIGCNICHVPTIQTAPVGTVINGNTFPVPAALGDKIIHPFGDFLLHNVGTGDGIVQEGGQSTRNRVRTVPLWGLHTRTTLMHDAASTTPLDAILRHGGEARSVIDNFRSLNTTQQNQLLTFLRSL